jgi:BMFP domain-containing protein YqiC
MTEEIKDVNNKIDQAESAVKKYASKDTVISIGGYEFTPAKLMVAFTLISSLLGGLYGSFEVYKDYQGMKKKITEYVSPDLTEIMSKLALLQQSSDKAVQYTQDIKNDLKQDIRRLETIVDSVERQSKQSQRDISAEIKGVQKEIAEVSRITSDAARSTEKISQQIQRDTEKITQQIQRDLDREIRTIRREVDDKIKRALDNPLSK